MAVQLDHPDWRLWPAVGTRGLWMARRAMTSPPWVAGPVPLEELPEAIAKVITERMPG
jgi:hypothetical protein